MKDKTQLFIIALLTIFLTLAMIEIHIINQENQEYHKLKKECIPIQKEISNIKRFLQYMPVREVKK